MENAKKTDKDMLREHVLGIVRDIENGITYAEAGREDLADQYDNGDADAADMMMTAFDYLDDILDIQYIVTAKREYLGARILVTFGGPNIWINTQAQIVEGYWWGDAVSMAYSDDPMGIDEACAELWEMGA
jgi:hypothetical protein